jgi:hypothetical protein
MAQSQSLFGSPGAPNPPTRQIDVGGAIDALTSGATSLLHNAMLRRNAQNELMLRRQDLALQQQREAREASAQKADFGLRQSAQQHAQTIADQNMDIQRASQARENTLSGFTPAHDEASADAVPDAMPTPITPLRPLASAMTSGLPPMQVTPSEGQSAAPPPAVPAPQVPASPMTAQTYHLGPSATKTTQIPATYDYNASAAGQGAHQHLADELTVSAQNVKNEKDVTALHAQLDLANRLKLIGPETDAKIRGEVAAAKAKFQYSLPKADDLKTAGLVPELVTSLRTLDAQDAPDVVTKLGAKGTLGNFLIGPQGQQFNQSADQFLQALAFSRSGKRINDQEIQRMRDAYIPKPGDTGPVLTAKRKARQQAVSGQILGSGRAAAYINPEDVNYLNQNGYPVPNLGSFDGDRPGVISSASPGGSTAPSPTPKSVPLSSAYRDLFPPAP